MTTEKPLEKLLEKPIPPEPHECCESGCGEYCVFELYLDEKRKYDEQQHRLVQTPTNPAP